MKNENNKTNESNNTGNRNEGRRMKNMLNIFVTHDICVGCFLAGRKVITHFDETNWPKFLDAAVAFLGRNGRARYGYMRCYDNKYTFDC